MSPTKKATTIKSITAKQMFLFHKEIRKTLWEGSFWKSGFYINTVGQCGNAAIIENYVKNQGVKYQQIYKSQFSFFNNLKQSRKYLVGSTLR